MGRQLAVTTASKGSPLITKSGFKGYDHCLNPYVGCGFGCSFCYVRFFIKDPTHEWGNFVRVREHIRTKLSNELGKPERGDPIIKTNKNGKEYKSPGPILTDSDGNPILKYKDKRLVIGTMTDPYQPIERKHRIMRKTLEILIENPIFSKVGIFTRSPIVLEDLDLIAKLPRARVHYSLSPFPKNVLQKLEPIAITIDRRLKTIQALKDSGIRVHVNVAPSVPIYSDDPGLTIELAKRLGKIGIDEFFVDPVQPYNESFTRMSEVLHNDPDWKKVADILQDKEVYLTWKQAYWDKWRHAWSQFGSANTLAIWSDHENHVWRKLVSGEEMDPKLYGDDLE